MNKFNDKKFDDHLIKIQQLIKEIDEKKAELAELTGYYKPVTPEPRGFNFKEAVLAVFKQSDEEELSIDEVKEIIASKHKFNPDRQKVANRLNYLTDREKTLERARRGFYRLKPKNPPKTDEGSLRREE